MTSSQAPAPSYRVALLIETSTKIGRDVLQGIHDYAGENPESWHLALQPGGLDQILPSAKTWKGTGIISRAAKPGTFSAIMKTGLPAVLFTLSDRQRKAIKSRNIVEMYVDSASVCRLAVDHLIERGLHHFAFVGNGTNSDWSRRRERAFARALADESTRPHYYPIDPRLSANWATESRRMVRWLKKLPKPVGIMAANDARGIQVMDACRQASLNVPDEVAVIGVDNDELLCTLCHPPLTSISLATTEAGYRAAQALHGLMLKKRAVVREILIPGSQVVQRESSATAVSHDWRVEKARKFILKKSGQMIQVHDVVEHVGVSRRSLEAHFVASVGHSLLHEISRVRIERAKTLLVSSANPQHVIARDAGFSDAGYMGKVFKKMVGLSPQIYRWKSHSAGNTLG